MKRTPFAFAVVPGALALLALPAPADVVITPADGFSITWDGNEGDNFDEANPAPVPPNLSTAPAAFAFASSDLGPELGIPYHITENLNDGLYGNANSWIGGGGFAGAPFAGISLGGLTTITSFAIGRDNGNAVTDPGVGGQLTDRSLGVYTIQITRVASPDGDTPDTGDPATGWLTIGTLDYISSDDPQLGDAFTSYYRHEYEVAEGAAGIQATGFRILVPATGLATGTAIDEIELYGPSVVNPDGDGDGFDDTLEIALGFDPTNPLSTPESRSGIRTAVEFSFYAAKNKKYRIEDSTDLLTWTLVEDNISGRGAEITRLYSTTSPPTRHFRAVRITAP
jgi:hypothetical protein